MVVSLGLNLDACLRYFLASEVLFSILLATPILKPEVNLYTNSQDKQIASLLPALGSLGVFRALWENNMETISTIGVEEAGSKLTPTIGAGEQLSVTGGSVLQSGPDNNFSTENRWHLQRLATRLE